MFADPTKKPPFALRIVASALTAVLLFTNVLFAHKPQETVWKDRRVPSIQVASLPLSPSMAPALSELQSTPPLASPFRSLHANIPLISKFPDGFFKHTAIRSLYEGKKESLVIVMEDIHQNKEAQAGLSAALQSLQQLSGSDPLLIGLEGAAGPFKYSDYHRFPDHNLANRVADSFLESGEISGPAHAGFTSLSGPQHKPLLFWGIEDPEAYLQNVQAYKRATAQKAGVRLRLEEEQKKINEKKRTVFSGDLQNLDRFTSEHRAGSLKLADYARRLTAITGSPGKAVALYLKADTMESAMDFHRIESERAKVLNKLVTRLTEEDLRQFFALTLAQKEGSLTSGDYYRHFRRLCEKGEIELQATSAFNAYIAYAELVDSLNSDDLFQQMEELEKHAYAKLLRRPEEHALKNLSDQIYLSRLLTDFSLTFRQWQDYKCHRREGLEDFEAFYDWAERRNKSMVENLLKKSKFSPLRVLVAGGFHTEGIARLLRQTGQSYLIVRPALSSWKDEQGNAYLNVFDREKTSLERIFTGEKLFLASPPAGAVTPLLSTVPDPTSFMAYLAEAASLAAGDAKKWTARVRANLRMTIRVFSTGQKGESRWVETRAGNRIIRTDISPRSHPHSLGMMSRWRWEDGPRKIGNDFYSTRSRSSNTALGLRLWSAIAFVFLLAPAAAFASAAPTEAAVKLIPIPVLSQLLFLSFSLMLSVAVLKMASEKSSHQFRYGKGLSDLFSSGTGTLFWVEDPGKSMLLQDGELIDTLNIMDLRDDLEGRNGPEAAGQAKTRLQNSRFARLVKRGVRGASSNSNVFARELESGLFEPELRRLATQPDITPDKAYQAIYETMAFLFSEIMNWEAVRKGLSQTYSDFYRFSYNPLLTETTLEGRLAELERIQSIHPRILLRLGLASTSGFNPAAPKPFYELIYQAVRSKGIVFQLDWETNLETAAKGLHEHLAAVLHRLTDMVQAGQPSHDIRMEAIRLRGAVHHFHLSPFDSSEESGVNSLVDQVIASLPTHFLPDSTGSSSQFIQSIRSQTAHLKKMKSKAGLAYGKILADIFSAVFYSGSDSFSELELIYGTQVVKEIRGAQRIARQIEKDFGVPFYANWMGSSSSSKGTSHFAALQYILPLLGGASHSPQKVFHAAPESILMALDELLRSGEEIRFETLHEPLPWIDGESDTNLIDPAGDTKSAEETLSIINRDVMFPLHDNRLLPESIIRSTRHSQHVRPGIADVGSAIESDQARRYHASLSEALSIIETSLQSVRGIQDSKLWRSNSWGLSTNNLEPVEELKILEPFAGELKKEMEIPGSGSVPTIVVMSDQHGSIERTDALIVDAIRSAAPGRLPDDFLLNSNQLIEPQLTPYGLSLRDLSQLIFFRNLGDMVDRGPGSLRVIQRIRELMSFGMADFIVGNHDLIMMLSLLSYHLPWYAGFRFYGYTDSYDSRLGRVEDVARDHSLTKAQWAEKLTQFQSHHERKQKSHWNHIADEKVNGKISEDGHGRSTKNSLSTRIRPLIKLGVLDPALWEKFCGISDGAPVQRGVKAVGHMSVKWWEDLLREFKKQSDNWKTNDILPLHAVEAFREAIRLIEVEILPELRRDMASHTIEKGLWWWRILEAINYHNYESPEWRSKDWIFHPEYGPSILAEVNQIGPVVQPRVTASNYSANISLLDTARFLKSHIRLYAKDAYQNTYMHDFLPIDLRTGEFFFTYKGVAYRGKGMEGHPSVWEGLDRVAADLRRLTPENVGEIQEAISLVMGWYSSASATKPETIAHAIHKFGAKLLSERNGFHRLFVGHITLDAYRKALQSQKPKGIGFHADARIFFADFGMAKKLGGRGAVTRVSPEGIALRGFEHHSAFKIVGNPRMIEIDGQEDGQRERVIVSNPPIHREAFLPVLFQQLQDRIAELKNQIASTQDQKVKEMESPPEIVVVTKKIPSKAPKTEHSILNRFVLMTPFLVTFISVALIPSFQETPLWIVILSVFVSIYFLVQGLIIAVAMAANKWNWDGYFRIVPEASEFENLSSSRVPADYHNGRIRINFAMFSRMPSWAQKAIIEEEKRHRDYQKRFGIQPGRPRSLMGVILEEAIVNLIMPITDQIPFLDWIIPMERKSMEKDSEMDVIKIFQDLVRNQLPINHLISTLAPAKSELLNVKAEFEEQVRRSLNSEKTSLAMLKTFASQPDGTESGSYITVDWGGSNARITLWRLLGEGKFQKGVTREFSFPEVQKQNPAGAFDALSEQVRQLIEGEPAENVSKDFYLGFTIAFPVEVKSARSVVLTKLSKGWSEPVHGPKIIGQDVMELLQASLRKHGLENVHVRAIGNDTLDPMLTATYENRGRDPSLPPVRIGAIIGTGHNVAVDFNGDIRNIESGNFDGVIPIYSPMDEDLDRETMEPPSGSQRFEKMVSGAYLGEIFRRSVRKIAEESSYFGWSAPSDLFNSPYRFKTEYLSRMLATPKGKTSLQPAIDLFSELDIRLNQEEAVILVGLADAIVTRSARLVGLEFAALLNLVDPLMEQEHVIPIEGSVFDLTPGYRDKLENALREFMGEEKAEKIKLVSNKGKTGLGAALLAATGQKGFPAAAALTATWLLSSLNAHSAGSTLAASKAAFAGMGESLTLIGLAAAVVLWSVGKGTVQIVRRWIYQSKKKEEEIKLAEEIRRLQRQFQFPELRDDRVRALFEAAPKGPLLGVLASDRRQALLQSVARQAERAKETPVRFKWLGVLALLINAATSSSAVTLEAALSETSGRAGYQVIAVHLGDTPGEINISREMEKLKGALRLSAPRSEFVIVIAGPEDIRQKLKRGAVELLEKGSRSPYYLTEVSSDLESETGLVDYRRLLEKVVRDSGGLMTGVGMLVHGDAGAVRLSTITDNPALYTADDRLMAVWTLVTLLGERWVSLDLNTVLTASRLALKSA